MYLTGALEWTQRNLGQLIYWCVKCVLQVSLLTVTLLYYIYYLYHSVIVSEVVEQLQRQSHRGHVDVSTLATWEQVRDRRRCPACIYYSAVSWCAGITIIFVSAVYSDPAWSYAPSPHHEVFDFAESEHLCCTLHQNSLQHFLANGKHIVSARPPVTRRTWDIFEHPSNSHTMLEKWTGVLCLTRNEK